MARLNAYQIAVAKTYDDGDYKHFAKMTAEQASDELPHCGDTLFAFLMIELAEREGCDSRAEAIARIDRASTELLEACRAVAALPIEKA